MGMTVPVEWGGAGADAVSLTGPQAGIGTDTMHRKAKILKIDPRRMRARNAETIGMEVVVALDRPPGRRVVQRQSLRPAVGVADEYPPVIALRLHRMG